MLIVSYDFSNDKIRTKFSKFLEQYGDRIQYSVFTLRDSPRILTNVLTEIYRTYQKKFKDTDSVIIYSVCEGCLKKVHRYGILKKTEADVVYL